MRSSWDIVKKPFKWLLVPTKRLGPNNKIKAENVLKNAERQRSNVRIDENKKGVIS